MQWARNRAGKGKPPDLAPFEWLIKPGRPIKYGQLLREEELTGPTAATRVWVADVKEDGKLDLLVGDCVTLIAPAKGVSEKEFAKRFAAWEKAVEAASKEMSSATGDQTKRAKVQQEYLKVYNSRTEFMVEDRTWFRVVVLAKMTRRHSLILPHAIFGVAWGFSSPQHPRSLRLLTGAVPGFGLCGRVSIMFPPSGAMIVLSHPERSRANWLPPGFSI